MQVDVDELVGRTLAGRYRVVRPIGRGGMGAVYEAVQLELDRRVAIKVLFGEEPRAVERFRQEALATANLVSPNVVAISDFCEPPDAPAFIVMELLEGESLAKLLGRERSLAPARAVGIALQVLAGLSVAHAAGVFHRDIKPGNIFLTRTAMAGDLVKVLDFGIAKLKEGGMKTTTGAFMGTPAYLAPEQLLGEEIGPSTDTRAVGVVLYEMLSGSRPWSGDDLLASVLTGDAPPLSCVRPELAAVVARALARAPRDRFATAEAMVAALSPFAGEARGATHGGDDPRKGARWPLFILGFAAPVVAGAVVLAVAARGVSPSPLALTPADTGAVFTSTDAEADAKAEVKEPKQVGDEDGETLAAIALPTLVPQAAAHDDDCVCVETRDAPPRVVLCPEKMAPRCSCASHSGERICRERLVRLDNGKLGCPVWDDFPLTPSYGCTGFVTHQPSALVPAKSVLQQGSLRCSFCYGTPRGRSAVHGAECAGFNGPGQASRGRWECAVQRAR
jgi:Protein kinase domain